MLDLFIQKTIAIKEKHIGVSGTHLTFSPTRHHANSGIIESDNRPFVPHRQSHPASDDRYKT